MTQETPAYKYRACAIFDEKVFQQIGFPSWFEAQTDRVGMFDAYDHCILTASCVDELRLKALAAGISDEEVDPVISEYHLAPGTWRPSTVRYR